jgi:hypothetical protein
MKRMIGLGAVVVFLNLLTSMAQNVPNRVPMPDFSAVPQAEIPSVVAETIKSAKPSEQEKVTVQVIKKAVRKCSSCAVAIVATAAHAKPEIASIAAGTAAKELPKQAASIARAASAAAPSEAGSIVIAVCRSTPKTYRDIAVAVAQAVPGSSRQILQALGTVFPELRSEIDRALDDAGGNQLSVAGVLDSVDLSLHSKTNFPSRISPVSNYGLADQSRLTKPPFIPLSGNGGRLGSTSPASATDGGRNYSSP